MSTEIIVALITSVFALIGVIITVYFSNKKMAEQIRLQAETTRKKNEEQAELTRYRIDQLERVQEKHNQVIERMYKVEDRVSFVEQRVDSLEQKVS